MASCDYCGQEFSRNFNLRRHLARMHSDELDDGEGVVEEGEVEEREEENRVEESGSEEEFTDSEESIVEHGSSHDINRMINDDFVHYIKLWLERTLRVHPSVDRSEIFEIFHQYHDTTIEDFDRLCVSDSRRGNETESNSSDR